MSWTWYVWIGLGLAVLGMAAPCLLHWSKHRRAREAFNRQPRYCDCSGRRRYIRIVEDLVEDCCIDCGRTRVMSLAQAVEHDCPEVELVAIGPAREDDGWTIQDFRCKVCGLKHDSVDGIMDTVLGGV